MRRRGEVRLFTCRPILLCVNGLPFLIALDWYLFNAVQFTTGARCGVVFKALRYKPAGRGFDSR